MMAHCGLTPSSSPPPTAAAVAATTSANSIASVDGASAASSKTAPVSVATAADASGAAIPFFIEAIEPLPPSPRMFPLTRTLASLADVHVMPETHLIYAGTWFTLAAFGAAIVYARFRVKVGVSGASLRGSSSGRRRAAAAL